MKYIKVNKQDGGEKELTHAEAVEFISRYYEEKVATYDEMLSVPGIIMGQFSYIKIEKD